MRHQPLSYLLLQTLVRGTSQLSEEARQRVCSYVNSQRGGGASFCNRGRQPDLYYTMFGWMLCYAMHMPLDGTMRRQFLNDTATSRLDDLHQTVFSICKMIDRLLALPRFTPQAVLRMLSDDQPLIHFFETYQRHGSGGGTNSWAARLAVGDSPDQHLVGRLLAMQDMTGGFHAHEGAVVPDLLSTAVATFALHVHQVPLPHDVAPFIEAHWQEDGSFVATLMDEYGDVEYEFYGLLALGSLA